MVIDITILIVSIVIINASFIIIIAVIVVNTNTLLSMLVYCSKNRRLHSAHPCSIFEICFECFVFVSKVLWLFA